MASITLMFSLCLLTSVFCTSLASDEQVIEYEVPKECPSKGLCTVKPPNYKELQEKLSKLIPKELLSEVEDRDGILTAQYPKCSPKSDWHNCPYTETILELPTYLDQLPLVQNENFKQSVIEVKCLGHALARIRDTQQSNECFPDLFQNPAANFGIKSACSQTYSTRLLYVYDKKNGALVMKPHETPVACSCQLSLS